ncbi:MAG TPA: DoxX family protein [Actinoplanes sp.]|nr:DoxX family protein [Actinoplanes sp.]
MNVVLWVIAAVLAVAFLGAGALKLLQPKEKLIASGLTWVEDSSAAAVKALGAVEILGAIGLILPALVDIAPILVPLAATGLAVTMIGAAITHFRRGELQSIAVNVVLFVLAAVVAWGRFGDWAF